MRVAVLLCYLCAIYLVSALVGNIDLAQFPMEDQTDEETIRPALQFSEEWEILGPFRIGTRGIRDRIRLHRGPCLTGALRGRVGS